MVSNGNSVLVQPDASPVTATRTKRRRGKSSWLGYAFVAPNLIGFAVFTLLPLIFAFAVSFADWDVISGLGGIRWVGLKNFSTIMTDGNFWHAARTTLIYVGVSVPITTAAGLLIALALNGPVPGRSLLRLIFFIPFIVNAVAISATWILLYHPRYSPLNNTLRALGVENPPLWLASSQWALPALIIMAIWGGCGFAAVIYLAALQDLPEDLFEAAELDGAGTIQKFRAITFPLITPTTFFLLVTGFIGASQSFGMINLMTRGGPGTSTTVASYYIYQNAFQFYKFGYAAAIAWVMFAFVLLLTLGLWLVQRRAVVYE
ncbi:MAG TPA: sugar ABC transporter permease [Thermomicrobiales bacterium]|nr:sugar ABC transporter permease [Thermomicrobiales bacterium]